MSRQTNPRKLLRVDGRYRHPEPDSSRVAAWMPDRVPHDVVLTETGQMQPYLPGAALSNSAWRSGEYIGKEGNRASNDIATSSPLYSPLSSGK